MSFLTVFTFMLLGAFAWESGKAFAAWLLGGGE